MKPTAIKALKLVYVLSFLPLLPAEGYLFNWILRQSPHTTVTQFMYMGIFCVAAFFFGLYLGVPHIVRRIRAKKIQFSFIYLLGCIILGSVSVILLPNLWNVYIGHTLYYTYLHAWFDIDSLTLFIPIPLGLILSGFFLTKAF